MCPIFLRPHSKLGHTTFLTRVPLALVPSPWGDCLLPLLSFLYLRSTGRGLLMWAHEYDSQLLHDLLGFPSVLLQHPLLLFAMNPPTPPNSFTLPVQCCPHWPKLMAIEVMLSQVLQYKAFSTSVCEVQKCKCRQ